MRVFTHEVAPLTHPAGTLATTPLVVEVTAAASWVKTDTDDPDLTDLLQDVHSHVEEHCRQPIYRCDFIVTLRGFECGYFASLYVSKIGSVKYRIAGQSQLQTLPETAYILQDNAVYFTDAVWAIRNVELVEIQFTAGPDPVPGGIKMAIRLLLVKWYEDRADGKKEHPSTVDSLLKKFVLPIV